MVVIDRFHCISTDILIISQRILPTSRTNPTRAMQKIVLSEIKLLQLIEMTQGHLLNIKTPESLLMKAQRGSTFPQHWRAALPLISISTGCAPFHIPFHVRGWPVSSSLTDYPSYLGENMYSHSCYLSYLGMFYIVDSCWKKCNGPLLFCHIPRLHI